MESGNSFLIVALIALLVVVVILLLAVVTLMALPGPSCQVIEISGCQMGSYEGGGCASSHVETGTSGVGGDLELGCVETITNDSTIIINGAASAGARISATGGEAESWTGADDDGRFSLTVPLVQNAENALIVTAYHTDGTVDESYHTVVHDDTAPASPSLPMLAAMTTSRSLTLSGLAAPGSLIIGSGDADGLRAPVDTSGEFSLRVPLALDVESAVYVSAVDAARNNSLERGATITRVEGARWTEGFDASILDETIWEATATARVWGLGGAVSTTRSGDLTTIEGLVLPGQFARISVTLDSAEWELTDRVFFGLTSNSEQTESGALYDDTSALVQIRPGEETSAGVFARYTHDGATETGQLRGGSDYLKGSTWHLRVECRDDAWAFRVYDEEGVLAGEEVFSRRDAGDAPLAISLGTTGGSFTLDDLQVGPLEGEYALLYHDGFGDPARFDADETSGELHHARYRGQVGAANEEEASLTWVFDFGAPIETLSIADQHSVLPCEDCEPCDDCGNEVALWTSPDGEIWTLRHDDRPDDRPISWEADLSEDYEGLTSLHVRYEFSAADAARAPDDPRGASLSDFALRAELSEPPDAADPRLERIASGDPAEHPKIDRAVGLLPADDPLWWDRGLHPLSPWERVDPDAATLTDEIELSLAAGEGESFRLVLEPAGTASALSLIATDLDDLDVQIWRLGAAQPDRDDPRVWPRATNSVLVDPADSEAIAPSQAAFWVTVTAEPGAASGTVSGALELTDGCLPLATIPLSVTVWDIELPPERARTGRFSVDAEHLAASLDIPLWDQDRTSAEYDAAVEQEIFFPRAPGDLRRSPAAASLGRRRPRR